MQQSQGTPGRRNPQTIAKAVRLVHQKLKPFANIYGIPVASMLAWNTPGNSARKILIFHVNPIAQKFGVKPQTLLKWAAD